jgi:hypothetical protein
MFMAKARLKLVTPTILRSFLGTTEAPGDVLGDTVTFGASATAGLIVGTGAEAGLTAGTNHIGQTNVLGAAAGMEIEFFFDVTRSSAIGNEQSAVATARSLTAAENAAVAAPDGPGVAYFNYHGSEYFIATNTAETSVSTGDAVIHLVGVSGLAATNSPGLVTLAHA